MDFMDLDGEIEEEEFKMWELIQSQKKKKTVKQKKVFGRGNAKSGARRKYQPYPPSDVFEQVLCVCVDELLLMHKFMSTRTTPARAPGTTSCA